LLRNSRLPSLDLAVDVLGMAMANLQHHGMDDAALVVLDGLGNLLERL